LFEDFEISSLGNKSLASTFMNGWFYAFYKVPKLGNLADNPFKPLEGIL